MPKLIYYRDKCIGCGTCQERQPLLWRMSKKDGKAVLLNSLEKKNIHQLPIHASEMEESQSTILACPARSIKLV